MNNREIVVKGIGKATAAPDLILVNMTLEVSEPDYEKTMQRGAEMLGALREAVISAGHEGKELKTTSFNINTKYESYNEDNIWKQRFAGYTCTHELKLEFDLEMQKLGATLGAIAKCEADPNFNIEFSVKDRNAVSERLLESAVENAKDKARVLAKAAGVALGEIRRIDYNWSDIRLYSNTDMQMSYGALRAADAAPMAIDMEPEDISVSDAATVVWAID